MSSYTQNIGNTSLWSPNGFHLSRTVVRAEDGFLVHWTYLASCVSGGPTRATIAWPGKPDAGQAERLAKAVATGETTRYGTQRVALVVTGKKCRVVGGDVAVSIHPDAMIVLAKDLARISSWDE